MHPLHPIERHWIRANLIAALISLAASLCIYAVRQATGAAQPGAGPGVAATQYAAAVLLCGMAGAVDGVLTGAVLQRITPRLPSGAWIVLRSVMAVFGGLVNERTISSPIEDASDPMPFFARVVLGAVFGAVIGASAGSLEALVIRKAASGVLAWIEWSAIGYAVGVGVLGALMVYVGWFTGIADEVVTQVLGVVVSMTIAIMVIPALRQLRPLPGN